MRDKIIGAAVIFFLLAVVQFQGEASGFSITTPAPKTIVEAGSLVQTSLEPAHAGQLAGVMFIAYGEKGKILGAQYLLKPPFAWALQLPPDYVGPATITATGKISGQEAAAPPEATTAIFVKLPGSVMLLGLRSEDNQKQFVMRPYAVTKLSIYGRYSDGMERDVTAEESGTTYDSTNKTIVLVNSQGYVTARGAGKAQIIIKNGSHTLTLQVAVQLKP